MRVVTAEPLTRFRCNQRGCCCRGWDIPFQVDDLVRLHSYVGARELNLEVHVEENELKLLKLGTVGEDAACRFLESGGGCRVHAQHGLQALPDICVDFPGVASRAEGRVELWWDPICPEVLARLDEGDAPLALVTLDDPAPDAAALAARAAHAREHVGPRIGVDALDDATLEQVRAAALGALDPSRPAWQSLCAVVEGFRTLRAGERLVPRDPADAAPFLRFLLACLGAHGPQLLARYLLRYRRFIHAVDPAPLLADETRLVQALDAWSVAGARWLEPQEPALRPLALRWMAHRFSMPYVNQAGELREAADTIVFLYATALRLASALGEVAQRPVDRPLFQVALGASEYVWRSLDLRRELLPWYAAERAQGTMSTFA